MTPVTVVVGFKGGADSHRQQLWRGGWQEKRTVPVDTIYSFVC